MGSPVDDCLWIVRSRMDALLVNCGPPLILQGGQGNGEAKQAKEAKKAREAMEAKEDKDT